MAKSKSSGIGFVGLLTIVFIFLKLAEIGQVAHWSWWWVLAPMWVGLAIVIFLVVIFGIFALLSK